jgi:TonB family protein
MVFIILKPLPPMGLMVYLPKLGTLSALKEPRNEPLVLRIDASRHFYLNQQPVPFGDLPKRLRAALSLRSDWTVFLDADPEVVAGDVIQTTGVIQQATGAKVVLVTPSMKKEDPRLYGGQPCKVVPLDTNYLKPWPTISRFNVSKYAPPLVSYEINERGEVQNVELERRSGIAAIDDWVVHSVQKWRFKPTHCGTIITQTSLVIHFQ